MVRFPIAFEVQFISDKVLLAISAVRLVDPWGLEGEMDARDSLSPSTVASSAASSVTATAAAAAASAAAAAVTVSPNRDGSSAGTEDDAVLSAVAALAKDAALHFQSSKFAECVEVLYQLLLKKQDDLKVNLVSIALAFALIQIFISAFFFFFFLGSRFCLALSF